jgi:hypothetical protein
MLTEWIIVIADTNTKPWPSAAKLVDVGVPLKMARRYQRIRRDMTAGLKRKLKESVN